jgi:pyruvate formate lyase activating enzyme
VIAIDQSQCTGCGECASVCPSGAITLVEGKASVDEAICKECELCLDICPYNAIISVETVEQGLVGESLPDPKPMPATSETTPSPSGGEVVPALGSILVSTGREVLPRLASMAMDLLDRRIQIADTEAQIERTQTRQRTSSQQGGGRRRRRHRRQGKW